MILGDFNCVIKINDSWNENIKKSRNLINLLDSIKVKDLWEYIHGDRVEFISEYLNAIHRCQIKPVTFSDHNALIIDIKI